MTLSTFTIFFWTLAGIIIFMFINEEKLIALEEKYDRKRAEQKKIRARQKAQKSTTHGKNR